MLAMKPMEGLTTNLSGKFSNIGIFYGLVLKVHQVTGLKSNQSILILIENHIHINPNPLTIHSMGLRQHSTNYWTEIGDIFV